jgi:hypothetical protein
MEKADELGIYFHFSFIDLKEVHDMVEIKCLHGILRECGVSKKLVNLAEMTLINSTSKSKFKD